MKIFRTTLLTLLTVLLLGALFSAAAAPGVSVTLGGEDAAGMADSVQLLLLFTVIALVPSILIMMTGFTRIVIVLSFLRNALGLQQTPPNQVLAGLALFLTLFLMSPVLTEINETAYEPYVEGVITQDEALSAAAKPMREFMLAQTRSEDLNMFLELAGQEKPESFDEIKTTTIIPAFVTSELRRAFIIGFLIYLPFLIIDMVVASILMSMGMVMLPPVMISLPFKVMLFVVVDGWGLLIRSLILSFNL
ncbi:MAG TPA: flagellar type III secretion system pore protein FliP [Candidatus Acidoferrum sp.]|nr:flagellar type III secretion system pore protein FliP [Candidatus Acidoferrum sp.]